MDDKVLQLILQRVVNVEQELKEINKIQANLVTELKLNTQILDAHHKRSTQLENRMMPVEDHVKFINKSIKGVLVVGGAAGLVLTMMRILEYLN